MGSSLLTYFLKHYLIQFKSLQLLGIVTRRIYIYTIIENKRKQVPSVFDSASVKINVETRSNRF